MSKGTGIGMKLYYFKYPYRIEILNKGMGMRHGQTSSPHEGPTFFTSAGYKKLFKELVVESLQSSAGVRENVLMTHIVQPCFTQNRGR